jgi:hypothetical protein
MSQEQFKRPINGWWMVLLAFLLLCALIAGIWVFALSFDRGFALRHPDLSAFFTGHPAWTGWILFFLALGFGFVMGGFMILQPGQAAVLLLFGKYVGSVKESGFYWVFPLYSRRKISLRLQNLNGDRLKVNDKAGNPIEIAMVMVWRVDDTFAASYEVENYQSYVKIQSESALRHMASTYPYDTWELGEEEITLRGNVDEVSKTLENELRDRLHKAGVIVVEARLSHLAYAPEIAEAMLRRQQATAIVAARFKIVEGAVGMVHLALDHLKKDGIVQLDEERKAAMVSNLLVVLCGEHAAQPVVNTGTLYQ